MREYCDYSSQYSPDHNAFKQVIVKFKCTNYWGLSSTILNKLILLRVDMLKEYLMSGKQCRPRSDAAFYGVWFESSLLS